MFSGWGKKKTAEFVEEEENNDRDEQGSQGGGSKYNGSDENKSASEVGAFTRGVVFDSLVVPSAFEKASLLKMLNELRVEGTFCDVAFLCQGVLFRAHKIVVSGWSRWLRALLTEGQDEEVVPLDVFSPDAFGLILDYMYGAQLSISLEIADGLIKVIRRLELLQLEHQCWKYLISIIDATNCKYLHELADRYECPPLKLSAWRLLQQTVPGYGIAPDLSAGDAGLGSYKITSTGFGGPGENPYIDDGEENGWNSDDDDGAPSLFSPNLAHSDDYVRRGDDGTKLSTIDENGGDYENEDDANKGEHGTEVDENRSSNRRNTRNGGTSTGKLLLPSELPPNASAADIVRAWSHRLTQVYDLCVPSGLNDSRGDESLPGDDVPAEEDEDQRTLYNSVKSSPQRTGNFGFQSLFSSPSKSRALDSAASSNGGDIQATKRLGRQLQRGGKASYDWKTELERIYISIKMPEKVADIPTILKMFKGKEDQMLGSILTKYKKHMSPDLYEYLDNLHSTFDTSSVAGSVNSPSRR